MSTTTIEVQDEYGRPIGVFDCDGYFRIPAMIKWQGRVFQRYGRLNNYRYIEEPITIVDAAKITLL